MSRILVWLFFNLTFRIVWAILRAIGQETAAALREATPRALTSAAQAVRAAPSGPRSHCGQCGSRVRADLPFCPSCGLAVNLEHEGLAAGPLLLHTCRACGAGVDLADWFCTSCGSPLARTPGAGARPAAVDLAATLHTLAGAGVALVTLPFAGVLAIVLAGNGPAIGFGWEVWAPLLLALVTWGAVWSGFSFAAAWGLRAAKPWALHATIAVALLWSLTAVGAIVAVPLIIALMLPSSRAYFGRGHTTGSMALGGPNRSAGSVIILGRR